MKIHIGAGAVYLTNWLNIDVPGPMTFLAHDRPDLVERLRTTEDEYYGRHADKTLASLSIGPLSQEYVCDRYGSFAFLPIRDGEAEEVLARHSFEHLSIAEAHQALDNIHRALQLRGLLRLDVPDHEQTLKLFQETQHDFYIRHLLGPRRTDDPYGYHMMSYRVEGLRSLVESHGYRFIEAEPNVHMYPSICLRWRRE